MGYTVKEISQMLGVSSKTAYRYVKKMADEFPEGLLSGDNGDNDNDNGRDNGRDNGGDNGRDNGAFRRRLIVSDSGLDYIKNVCVSTVTSARTTTVGVGVPPSKNDLSGAGRGAVRYSAPASAAAAADAFRDDYIEFLKAQIAIKDKTIENLTEQLNNYSKSVLIGQQSKSVEFIPDTTENVNDGAPGSVKRHFWSRFKK